MFHLKRPWVGERSFVLWKLTYVALCKFIPFWLHFSPFWSNFFKDFFQGFGLLLVGRPVFKVSCLSNVPIYWNLVLIMFFQVSILSISRKVMERNYKLKSSKWKVLRKNKKPKLSTKEALLEYFRLKFEKANVMFEISALEL